MKYGAEHLSIFHKSTFKSALISDTFESGTKFFFSFLNQLGNFKHFEPYLFFSSIFKSITNNKKSTFECALMKDA